MNFDEFCSMVREREPQAQTAALRELFQRIDVNQDGKIYAKDWHKEHLTIDLLEELSHRSERLADLFDDMDKDHSGTLNSVEFVAAVRNLHLRCAEGCSDGDLHDVFKALDVDHSTHLDFHELTGQMHALLAHDHCGRYMAVKTRLRSSATKNPGAALLPNVIIKSGPDALQQLHDVVAQQHQKVINLFNEWDYNGDGLVSRNEFHKAMAHLSFDAPKATVDALFDIIDKNKSSYIEYRELTKALHDHPALNKPGAAVATTHTAPTPRTASRVGPPPTRVPPSHLQKDILQRDFSTQSEPMGLDVAVQTHVGGNELQMALDAAEETASRWQERAYTAERASDAARNAMRAAEEARIAAGKKAEAAEAEAMMRVTSMEAVQSWHKGLTGAKKEVLVSMGEEARAAAEQSEARATAAELRAASLAEALKQAKAEVAEEMLRMTTQAEKAAAEAAHYRKAQIRAEGEAAAARRAEEEARNVTDEVEREARAAAKRAASDAELVRKEHEHAIALLETACEAHKTETVQAKAELPPMRAQLQDMEEQVLQAKRNSAAQAEAAARANDYAAQAQQEASMSRDAMQAAILKEEEARAAEVDGRKAELVANKEAEEANKLAEEAKKALAEALAKAEKQFEELRQDFEHRVEEMTRQLEDMTWRATAHAEAEQRAVDLVREARTETARELSRARDAEMEAKRQAGEAQRQADEAKHQKEEKEDIRRQAEESRRLKNEMANAVAAAEERARREHTRAEQAVAAAIEARQREEKAQQEAKDASRRELAVAEEAADESARSRAAMNDALQQADAASRAESHAIDAARKAEADAQQKDLESRNAHAEARDAVARLLEADRREQETQRRASDAAHAASAKAEMDAKALAEMSTQKESLATEAMRLQHASADYKRDVEALKRELDDVKMSLHDKRSELALAKEDLHAQKRALERAQADAVNMARKLIHFTDWQRAQGIQPPMEHSMPHLTYDSWPPYDASDGSPMVEAPPSPHFSPLRSPPAYRTSPPPRVPSPPPRPSPIRAHATAPPPSRTSAPSRAAAPSGRAEHIDASTPRPLAQFLACFQCTAKDATSRQRRDELFLRFASGGRGYLSLADVCAGVKSVLASEHGKAGVPIYHRYYRSYIRAFNDAKDAAPARARRPDDDEYVTKPEFRLLMLYLTVYATLYEVFAYLIDVGSRHPGDAADPDHRVTREEWVAALDTVRKAGRSWAPYIRLREARATDFDDMDQNAGGFVDFLEFCEWVEATEKLAGTAIGVELGEPIDSPGHLYNSGHLHVDAYADPAPHRRVRSDPGGPSLATGPIGTGSDEHVTAIMRKWGYQKW